MSDNPVVKTVRDARHRISAKYNHDLNRLFEHYKRRQERLESSGKYCFVGDASRRIGMPVSQTDALALKDETRKKK